MPSGTVPAEPACPRWPPAWSAAGRAGDTGHGGQRQRGQQRPSGGRVRHERKVHKDLLNYGRGDAGHRRLAASRPLKRPCRRQVQARYGPGNQERGGLWPGAASAWRSGRLSRGAGYMKRKPGLRPWPPGSARRCGTPGRRRRRGSARPLKALRHLPRARRSRASPALPIHGRNWLMRLCRGC